MAVQETHPDRSHDDHRDAHILPWAKHAAQRDERDGREHGGHQVPIGRDDAGFATREGLEVKCLARLNEHHRQTEQTTTHDRIRFP